MGRIGPMEILIILVIALVVFGPSRLPELGRAVGRGLREFRNATQGLSQEISQAVEAPAQPAQPARPAAPAPAAEAAGGSAGRDGETGGGTGRPSA
ncbi:MAG: twin-arginine translocase TatA/TatE family subunit [Firmicutes bacterium]|nr:twin-arginine translocase TatA/TatE family subunit [Bacillota bacterium]